MVFLIILITFGFSAINLCFSMVIPIRSTVPSTTTATATSSAAHVLHVRIRVNNSLIETLVNKRQLDIIENQLQERHIPYHQIQDDEDGITIIIGPLHKSVNLTATELLFNQSRFQTNFTQIIPNQTDAKNQRIILKGSEIPAEHLPMSVEAHEYNLVRDQESYEFRSCLELCEVFEDNEFRPDHDCIRQKCLKEITGI